MNRNLGAPDNLMIKIHVSGFCGGRFEGGWREGSKNLCCCFAPQWEKPHWEKPHNIAFTFKNPPTQSQSNIIVYYSPKVVEIKIDAEVLWLVVSSRWLADRQTDVMSFTECLDVSIPFVDDSFLFIYQKWTYTTHSDHAVNCCISTSLEAWVCLIVIAFSLTQLR